MEKLALKKLDGVEISMVKQVKGSYRGETCFEEAGLREEFPW